MHVMMRKCGKIALSALFGLLTGSGIIVTFFSMFLCSNFFSSSPADSTTDSTTDETYKSYELVMATYLEEKYGEHVLCRKGEFDEESGIYEGRFMNYNNRDILFTCTVHMDEKSGTYKYADDYQANLYLSEVQEQMETIAKKYFDGEHYVVVEKRGLDSGSKMVSREECIGRYGQYCVYIYEYGMSTKDAYNSMQEFVAEVEGLGLQYSFYLGRNIDDDKEKYLRYIQGDINSDWNRFVEWIYYKWLPPLERKMEPKVFILKEGE